jgi:hypothetical protein
MLTLIDLGEADGLLYYVLPYIRGESLRDRLTREQQGVTPRASPRHATSGQRALRPRDGVSLPVHHPL